MDEWTCVLCGHFDQADSQYDQALQVASHYEQEHPAISNGFGDR